MEGRLDLTVDSQGIDSIKRHRLRSVWPSPRPINPRPASLEPSPNRQPSRLALTVGLPPVLIPFIAQQPKHPEPASHRLQPRPHPQPAQLTQPTLMLTAQPARTQPNKPQQLLPKYPDELQHLLPFRVVRRDRLHGSSHRE
jgi:hypothetical protein